MRKLSPIYVGVGQMINFEETIVPFIRSTFRIKESQCTGQIRRLVEHIKKELYFLMEYPYVDKVYRNSYYNYFSTKHNDYQRNSIRVSLFKDEVKIEDFYNNADKLQSSFLGYATIRPTLPIIMGRSLIAPMALRESNFYSCQSSEEVLINGVKLKVEGFPHCGQDAETMTCAETTIWTLMEYFGHKYPEYKPVLPSDIMAALKLSSYQRQLPSTGLNVLLISKALTEFGFGVKHYSKDQYGSQLETILHDYVESGIPVVVAIAERKGMKLVRAHAILFVGHFELNFGRVKYYFEQNSEEVVRGNSSFRYMDSFKFTKSFVAIDDNYPPYQKGYFDKPSNYSLLKEDQRTITGIIVPLYSKVYLEAFQARKILNLILSNKQVGFTYGKELITRFFLTSSRSFKQKVSKIQSENPGIRDYILYTALPRFIWVAELITPDSYEKEEAIGYIILDATEATKNSFEEPIIFIAYPDSLWKHQATYEDKHDGHIGLERFPLKIKPFSLYKSNLKQQFNKTENHGVTKSD